jgi:hypothetical protein
MSNFFNDLEAQLDAAARARAGGSRLRARGRPGWLGGALSMAIAVALTVTVAAVILSAGHRHGRTPTAGHHAPRPPSQLTVASYVNRAHQATANRDPGCAPQPLRVAPTKVSDHAPSQALLSRLAVLRRPATAGDRLPPRVRGAGFGPPGGVLYERYIRRARIADGVSYYVIPGHFPPPIFAVPMRCYAEQRAALRDLTLRLAPAERAAIISAGNQMIAQQREARSGDPTKPYDGVAVFADGGESCCQNASSLIDQVSIGIDGHTGYGLVADGVARVALYYAKTSSQNPRTIIALATHTITVKVSDNMYVVNLGDRGRPAAVAYLSANGTVLRRFDTNQ